MASRRKRARRRPPTAGLAAKPRRKGPLRAERLVRPKRPPTPGPVTLGKHDRWAPVGWMFASAVLFFFCFPQKLGPIEIELSPLAFVCLVPLTLGAVSIRGSWRGAGWAMLAGWAAMLGGLYWTIWITTLGSAALAWYLSWYWVAFYAVIRWTKRRLPILPLAVTVPVVWVALELVRAYMLTGFPWLYLAHSQYRLLPLIQISDLVGAYGVSALVATVNGLIADAVIFRRRQLAAQDAEDRPPRRPVILSAAVVLGLCGAALAYGWVRLGTLRVVDGPKISAVQGRIPQQLAWQADFASNPNTQKEAHTARRTTGQIFAEHLALTREEFARIKGEGEQPPEQILWPETTVMIDGGLNAYGKSLRLIYGAEPTTKPTTKPAMAPATEPAQASPPSLRPPQPPQALLAEAWDRFADTAVRIAAGRASWQERLVLSEAARRVFYPSPAPTDVNREAREEQLRERAWARVRDYFDPDVPPPPASETDLMHEAAWLWFRMVRIAEYDTKVKPILDLAEEHGSCFLLGAVAFTPQADGSSMYYRRRNAAFLVRCDRTIQKDFYVKRHLVPFGEYLPFRKEWPWLYELILSFSPVRGPDGKPRDHSSLPGERDVIFSLPGRDGKTYSFASPICFEITVPRVCRRFVVDRRTQRKRCDFLVNISNDGWFEGTSEHAQHFSSAVFRAVELRVGVVRSVNTGISGFISPTGETYGTLPPSVTGVSTHRVRIAADAALTLYARMGDLFAWAIAALAALLVVTDAAFALQRQIRDRREPQP